LLFAFREFFFLYFKQTKPSFLTGIPDDNPNVPYNAATFFFLFVYTNYPIIEILKISKINQQKSQQGTENLSISIKDAKQIFQNMKKKF